MGRSPCCEKAHTNKGAWTKEEDQRLIAYIRAHGEGCWRTLPKAAGLLRCGKSCRLRWINYLRPDLKRGNFTEEEDELIIKLHAMLGNKWSLIAGRLPGRTDNEIKNYWNTHIKRKLLSRGVDPQTHRPLGAATAPTAGHPSPTSAAPLEASSITDAAKAAAAAASMKTASDSTEDAGSRSAASTYDEHHPGLNLDLSISLAFYPSKQSSSSTEASSTTTATTAAATSNPRPSPAAASEADAAHPPFAQGRPVCLCCHLGFQRTEACGSCQTAPNPHANLRYFIPLQGGQHVID
ncbi:hypothetical protein Taro_003514 [Colocasia esculenta]|uniref:Uncharacterized protein n=2 Tax=Araceae TaxID=4454 RepID=A0A843TJH9_COLES|nr:hypothetical protein [Colocasia esculenta]